MQRRIVFRKGEGCVYTRCPFCGMFISEESDGTKDQNREAKDKVGEALAHHANVSHLPGN